MVRIDDGLMSDLMSKASRSDGWRKQIADEQRSGLSVREFCAQRTVNENAFYKWRKQLQTSEAVRFALVEPAGTQPRAETTLAILLATGERLRIGAGVDGPTLRTVLEALRR